MNGRPEGVVAVIKTYRVPLGKGNLAPNRILGVSTEDSTGAAYLENAASRPQFLGILPNPA